MQPPTLSDEEHPDAVRLRPHDLGDVDAVLAMCRDEQMQRWTTVPVPYERAHAEAFLASRAAEWDTDGDCTLAIEAVDDTGRPRLAGNVAVRPTGSGAAEIGYALAPWARGRGVMSRAVRLALAWAFSPVPDGGLGLLVVHWQAHVGNWESRRVAWACGFRIEGTVRGLCHQRGLQHDAWIGSIVRGDPMAAASEWLEVPELAGRQVRLRPWRITDAPRVVEACTDPRTQQWLPQLPSPYTVTDAQWYIGSRPEEAATARGLAWCVADAGDDRCLGSIALMKLDGPTPDREIGYWAHPDARSRGVITEATSLVLDYAQTPAPQGGLGFERVTLRADAANRASAAVAERAGMTPYGTAHAAERARDGSLRDLVLFERVVEQPRPTAAVTPPGGGVGAGG
jgi:RimJ/RimL family protein N-acetyltransferase